MSDASVTVHAFLLNTAQAYIGKDKKKFRAQAKSEPDQKYLERLLGHLSEIPEKVYDDTFRVEDKAWYVAAAEKFGDRQDMPLPDGFVSVFLPSPDRISTGTSGTILAPKQAAHAKPKGKDGSKAAAPKKEAAPKKPAAQKKAAATKAAPKVSPAATDANQADATVTNQATAPEKTPAKRGRKPADSNAAKTPKVPRVKKAKEPPKPREHATNTLGAIIRRTLATDPTTSLERVFEILKENGHASPTRISVVSYVGDVRETLRVAASLGTFVPLVKHETQSTTETASQGGTTVSTDPVPEPKPETEEGAQPISEPAEEHDPGEQVETEGDPEPEAEETEQVPTEEAA